MELGISSPLTQTGACKALKSWLVDTASIYSIGAVRTGVTIVALSLGNVGIGGATMALNRNESWSGMGLWTGFPMFVCGLVSIAMRRKRPVNIVSALSVLGFIAILATLVSMATSIFSIWSLSHDPSSIYPNYIKNLPEEIDTLYVMNGLLLSLSPLQMFFVTWCLCLSIGYVWPCLRPDGASIFTIMIEEDAFDRALDQDHDTEMVSFNENGTTQRILQIQTEWLDPTPRTTAVGR